MFATDEETILWEDLEQEVPCALTKGKTHAADVYVKFVCEHCPAMYVEAVCVACNQEMCDLFMTAGCIPCFECVGKSSVYSYNVVAPVR